MHTPRPRRARALAAATGGVVLLAACGGGDDDDDQAGGDPPPAAATSTTAASATSGTATTVAGAATTPTSVAPAENEALRRFAGASTIDGSDFDASALAGRDTVAWFWAPWCVICAGEGPDVADVAARYADQATMIGVAGRGELDDMATFVETTGTGGFTHVADLDGAIWAAFGVYGQPAYAFINDDGTVEVFVGSLGADALAERIDTLIAT